MPDSIIAELLSHVEAKGAVLVIQAALVRIAQCGVGAVDLLEPLGCRWVIGVLVWMVLESQLPVGCSGGTPSMASQPHFPGQSQTPRMEPGPPAWGYSRVSQNRS